MNRISKEQAHRDGSVVKCYRRGMELLHTPGVSDPYAQLRNEFEPDVLEATFKMLKGMLDFK